MKTYKRFFLTFTISMLTLFSGSKIYAQASLPEVLEKGTLVEQKDYLEDKMNNYNGYRAVREDIFLKILKNSVDSLNFAKKEIIALQTSSEDLKSNISSLNNKLADAKNSEANAIKEKNSLVLFGALMNKTTYNIILWGIIAGLVFILVLLFTLYKKNYSSMSTLRKDLEDTREEFEIFRKNSREKQEQLVISHFNEIKKLKGGA